MTDSVFGDGEHISGEVSGQPRHFFDPFLMVRSGPTLRNPMKLPRSGLCDYIWFARQELDRHFPRKRKRRPDDEENHTALLNSIIANLAYPIVAGLSDQSVSVPLGKPKGKRIARYEHEGIRQLPILVSQLETCKIVTVTKSRRDGHASTIEAYDASWGLGCGDKLII